MYYKDDPTRNASGYKDTTAYNALRDIESEERFKAFLKALWKLAEKHGFHIDERVVVTDTQTGKKWR